MLCLGHAVPASFPIFCDWTSVHRSVIAGQGSSSVLLFLSTSGEVGVQVGIQKQAAEPVNRGAYGECWLCDQPSPNLSAAYPLDLM